MTILIGCACILMLCIGGFTYDWPAECYIVNVECYSFALSCYIWFTLIYILIYIYQYIYIWEQIDEIQGLNQFSHLALKVIFTSLFLLSLSPDSLQMFQYLIHFPKLLKLFLLVSYIYHHRDENELKVYLI